MSGSDLADGIQSIDRALYILELIKKGKGVTLTSLADTVGLHKSTVYRVLKTFGKWGYVRQTDNKYYLGLKFFEMASELDFYNELRLIALPVLEKLVQDTRETVHLTVFDNYEVLYLEKVESPETIRMYSRIGGRMPAYSTASGKVFLAELSSTELSSYFREVPLEARTGQTITEPARLIEELEWVRAAGFAIDNEENEAAIRCIAAPVKMGAKVVASISISCPAFRTPITRLLEMKEGLLVAAKDISARL